MSLMPGAEDDSRTATGRQDVTSQIERLTTAERMLAEIATAADAVDVIRYAEAARVFAEQARLGTSAVNHATVIKMRAERRLADAVDKGQEKGEIASKAQHGRGIQMREYPPLGDSPTPPSTLADIGVSPQRLHEARKIRDNYTDDDLIELEDKANANDEVLSRRELVTRAARDAKEAVREQKRAENQALVENTAPLETAPDMRYQAIVIDPPWDWGDEGDADQFGRARPVYRTLSYQQLTGLPVGEQADANAHLYLWITNRSLPKGFGLLEAWGFRYVTTLTWCKPSFGMGNYYRGQTEHVLFGVRGSLPLLRRDRGTWFAAPRPGRHSAKPDAFYELVEECSPGPWLEMFSRSARPGWAAWGAEA